MGNEKLNVLSVYHLHNPSLMMEQINLAHVLPCTLPRCHEERMQKYSLNFSWQCSQLFTLHYIELNWFKQRMLQINFTLDMGNHRHTNPSRAVMSKHETIEAPGTAAIVFMFTLSPIRLHSNTESRSVKTIALLMGHLNCCWSRGI